MCGAGYHSLIQPLRKAWGIASMIGIERAARPRLLGNLFAKHGDVARGGHSNSDLSAPNLENRYVDIVSDGHRLCRPSGQNEHDPLPPCVICIHYVRIDIIVS